MREVNLNRADFSLANMILANMEFVEANGANFSMANLCRAKCQNGSFVGADFRGANLEKTRFKNANLTKAKFFVKDILIADIDGAIFDIFAKLRIFLYKKTMILRINEK
jgi:uncharacterized protein YjbI with pentapeptide repeats